MLNRLEQCSTHIGDPIGTNYAMIEAFAKLVADKEREGLVRIIEANIADERDACAALIESYGTWENTEVLCQALRNRGEE